MFLAGQFILFVFAAVIFYYFVVPKKVQWIFLLVLNFLFYFSAGRFFCIFLLATSISVYLAGICLEHFDKKLSDRKKSDGAASLSRAEKKVLNKKIGKKKKTVMLLCLFFNIGILAVVKYTNFAIDNVNWFLERAGRAGFSYVDMIVPLGISFYTFQSVGYLLDVYWKKCKAQRNFFRFTLFVSLFPQLIQGPISRYGQLEETLYKPHPFDWNMVRFGVERCLWGYFKKMVIADRIGIAVASLSEDPKYYTGAFVIIGMLFYAAQLYADFTGGIDITIGVAQIFGIRLEENFIRPYFSKNIAEYWRRWHISMGTWFRDYVFYPCSISRPLRSLTGFLKKRFGIGAAKRAAVYISTMVCWLATGIWHGAAWHYVVWGLLNGVIILVSEELSPLYKLFHRKFPKMAANPWYSAFQVLRTFCLMSCLRLFDIYGSVRLTFRQFVSVFTKLKLHRVTLEELTDLGLSVADYTVFAAGVVIMFVVSMCGRNGSIREKIAAKPYIIRYILFLLLLFSVLLLGQYGIGYHEIQFIYNQF